MVTVAAAAQDTIRPNAVRMAIVPLLVLCMDMI